MSVQPEVTGISSGLGTWVATPNGLFCSRMAERFAHEIVPLTDVTLARSSEYEEVLAISNGGSMLSRLDESISRERFKGKPQFSPTSVAALTMPLDALTWPSKAEWIGPQS